MEEKSLGQRVDAAKWSIVITSDRPNEAVIEAQTAEGFDEAQRIWNASRVSGLRSSFADKVHLIVTEINGTVIGNNTTLRELGDQLYAILRAEPGKATSKPDAQNGDPEREKDS